MDLEEDAVDARGDGRPRQGGHELPLAGGDVARPARKLHAVGGVEDHGTDGVADRRKPPEVDDQVVVPEGGPPFRHQDVFVARGADLLHRVAHVPRRHELPLLDVHRHARLPRRDEQVGLAAKERRDLEQVDTGGDGDGLPRVMDVGGDGKAVPLPHLREDAKPLGFARPAVRCPGGTVRLVERSLEHHGEGEPGGEIREESGDGQGELLGFEDARPRDEQGRAPGADPEPVRDGDPSDHAFPARPRERSPGGPGSPPRR